MSLDINFIKYVKEVIVVNSHFKLNSSTISLMKEYYSILNYIHSETQDVEVFRKMQHINTVINPTIEVGGE